MSVCFLCAYSSVLLMAPGMYLNGISKIAKGVDFVFTSKCFIGLYFSSQEELRVLHVKKYIVTYGVSKQPSFTSDLLSFRLPSRR